MSFARPRRDRTVELWHRVGTDATRLAFLLDPNEDAARATARRVFSRCLTRLQDRRSTYLIDVAFRRDVVRLVIRRRRRRALHALLSRGPVPLEEPGIQLGHRNAAMWRAFVRLRPRQRAVIALECYEGLARAEAADVLGCSHGGATALVDHGLEALAARLGDVPDAGELEGLLREVAGGVDGPALEPDAIRNRARRARTVGVVAVLCVVGALVAATAAIVTTASDPEDGQRQVIDGGTPRVIVAEPDDGLSFEGAPGWCPDPRRALSLGPTREREVALAAERVAMSLVNGYARRLAHLIEVPAGAPPAKRWPVTPGPAGLRVVGSGPGTANDRLTEACGVEVAARTWITILQDPFPPRGDAVAFYVLRRADGLKVWGSFGGTAD